MALINRSLVKLTPNFRLLVRFSSSTGTTFSHFEFKSRFSHEEETRILHTLNEDKDHLLNLNVSQAKIKSMETYKSKKGPFKSLNEVLEVDGLGVRILEQLCEDIIFKDCATKPPKTTNKRPKHFLVPPLPPKFSPTSVVGIHIEPRGISWAKLQYQENQLQCWGHHYFEAIPKKILPTDTFKLALSVVDKIPVGDVYVFEGTSSMRLQGQKQSSTVSSYTQQSELTSMLLTLINTSSIHNSERGKDPDDDHNKVHFMRPKLPARLFKTLVGNECVSTNTAVSQLIDKNKPFSLPCTPINLGSKLKNDYSLLTPADQELLGQALILTVAFIDLCVRRNPTSLSAVAPGKR